MPRTKRFAAYRQHGAFQGIADVGDEPFEYRLEADYVVPETSLADHVKMGARSALGAVGRLVYLAPLLWGASIVVSPPASHILLVTFVAIAVLFFALLNLFVVASAIAWHAAKTKHHVLAPPHRDGPPRQLPATAVPQARQAPPSPGQRVTARGRVVSLASALSGAPVLVDVWATDEVPLRLTEATAFAVRADDQLPVVVAFHTAPVVYGRPQEGRLAGALATMSSDARALYAKLPVKADGEDVETLAIRPGDEVHVTGVVTAVLDDVTRFSLDGQDESLSRARQNPATPYRASERQRGLLVGSSLQTPLLIEKLEPL